MTNKIRTRHSRQEVAAGSAVATPLAGSLPSVTRPTCERFYGDSAVKRSWGPHRGFPIITRLAPRRFHSRFLTIRFRSMLEAYETLDLVVPRPAASGARNHPAADRW